jgi:indolepyruvate ferredoxin oxidoreductase beta subunit
LLAAVAARARRALLGDLRAVAEQNGVSTNAVILGVLAASGLLPMPRQAFEDAVRASDIAVDANLAGFNAGFDHRFAAQPEPAPADADFKRLPAAGAPMHEQLLGNDFPDTVRDVLRMGVRRLVGYQDAAYGLLYLDRLAVVRDAERAAGGDQTLTVEVARRLANRMSYEDIIRVAQLKTAADRFQRVRDEVRAAAGEPVVIIDYFKPGIDELCSILPPALARRLAALCARRGWTGHMGLRIKTSTVTGFLLVWLLARLKFLRRTSFGYQQTQISIEQWLDDVCRAAPVDLELALEVARCAQLIKGYGDTFERGAANLARIRDAVIQPALAGHMPTPRAVDALANARLAALADPDGDRLGEVLGAIGESGLTEAAE